MSAPGASRDPGEAPQERSPAAALVQRLDAALRRAELGLLSLGILGIAAVAIANVASRNLLGGSLAWAQEVSEALVLVVTFAGVSVGAREARHIRMAALYDQLRGRSRKAVWTLSAALTSLLLFALAWLAVGYVASVAEIGRVTPALRIPQALVYAVVPLGLTLGGVQYALIVLRNLTRRGLYATFDRTESDLESDPSADVDGAL